MYGLLRGKQYRQKLKTLKKESIHYGTFWKEIKCNKFLLRTSRKISELQEKPQALQRENLAPRKHVGSFFTLFRFGKRFVF
jgi:hypothetical protein